MTIIQNNDDDNNDGVGDAVCKDGDGKGRNSVSGDMLVLRQMFVYKDADGDGDGDSGDGVEMVAQIRIDRVESKALQLINSPPLTVFSLFLTDGMLHLLPSFITIFMLTALLIFLTAYLPSSCGLSAQAFLLPLIPILSSSLTQELTNILNHTYLPLVNSGTPCLLLYFHLPST
ncbi:hypothetical protein E2C01_040628 [Portunus trituberculatus]|uniref:Uncharacterized protein n=1 Tax=Portunus trituberculatus TaxID=210409 RepID=A0A5B7FPQ6_PORTR|nr:hypothetical protein [Portunus trituberculatus]